MQVTVKTTIHQCNHQHKRHHPGVVQAVHVTPPVLAADAAFGLEDYQSDENTKPINNNHNYSNASDSDNDNPPTQPPMQAAPHALPPRR